MSREFGESFFLCDPDRFKRNYDDFLGLFRAIYPRTQLAYSYKTNYTPALCRLVEEWGGYAEVVSGMEYELAVRLGVPGEGIIFNGPYKPKPALGKALLEGALVNLDSAYELELVEEAARRNPDKTLRLGLRCAFEVGLELPTRFGFNADDGSLTGAVKRLRGIPNVELAALHCHYMPPGRTPERYRQIAERMLALSAEFYPDRPPRILDLGGGFYSRMAPALRQQFGSKLPEWAEYAGAIAEPFRQAFPNGDGPELVLEPGMAVVADVFQFVTRVVDIKRIGGRTTALASGSVYDIRPTKSLRNLPVRRLAGGGKEVTGKMDIVGYTCMEDDILHRDYEGGLAAGDFLVFSNTGAYTIVLKPPFILPASPIVTIGGEQMVRRAETVEDIFSAFKMERGEHKDATKRRSGTLC